MMKSTLISIVMLAVGAAIGSAVTAKLIKTKYEKIADEEIESYKAMCDRKYNSDTDEEDIEGNKETVAVNASSVTPDIREYSAMLQKQQYTNENKADVKIKPYVIKPVEFGEHENYDVATLTYYTDGVLTDDMDNVIEDVDYIVGKESLNHFGEYEEDMVCVRNDNLLIDYEIVLAEETFYNDESELHLTED